MRTILMSTPRIVVRVCRYAPGERHRTHTDPFSRISYVVQGAFTEDDRSGSALLAPGEVLLKSSTVKHENQFGPDGSVLVALEFLDDDPLSGRNAGLWCKRVDAAAMRQAAAFVEAALARDPAGAEIAGADLVAASTDAETRRGRAPRWLEHIRDDLAERGVAMIDVAERAHEAGVHPAHASRLFRRCYGVSITEHAQAHSVRRAVARLPSRAALSAIALDAGFYDQAHMNRVFRRVLGRTPGAQRALMREACG